MHSLVFPEINHKRGNLSVNVGGTTLQTGFMTEKKRKSEKSVVYVSFGSYLAASFGGCLPPGRDLLCPPCCDGPHLSSLRLLVGILEDCSVGRNTHWASVTPEFGSQNPQKIAYVTTCTPVVPASQGREAGEPLRLLGCYPSSRFSERLKRK